MISDLLRPWRCDVTGNPVGTDTILIGQPPCDCQGCRADDALRTALAQLDEARAERDENLEDARRVSKQYHTLGEELLQKHRALRAAESRLEELTRERDEFRSALATNCGKLMVAEGRLEEAKAALAFYAAKENWWNDETSVNKQELFDVPMGDDLGDKARAFLHQGGSDAR